MNTCDSCKWWIPEETTDEQDWHPCRNPKCDSEGEQGFGVVDGEPFNAGRFASGAKFGCIHHEPKLRHTLILVLSALRRPWDSLMECSRATWDSIEHPQTTTLYYVGRSTETPRSRMFYSVFDEELNNVGRRTMEAYEHALTLDWTHLVRPHSSTYVHKRRLVDYIETLPAHDVFAGLATGGPDTFMWGGGHYIFSRDVIERLVEHKQEWDHRVMEDVAVSELTRKLGIPWTNGRTSSLNPSNSGKWEFVTYGGKTSGYSFTNFEDVNLADDQFLFRVKHDSDRSVDLQTMRLLFEHLT